MAVKAAALLDVLRGDARRMHLLRLVRGLELSDGWTGAGFVRDAVWDRLHDREPTRPLGDVDVIWFDRERVDADVDAWIEARLGELEPTTHWSVKNQARMHLRNGDPPYRSATNAMEHWPETATAVAVRLDDNDCLQIVSPFGLDDLLGGVVRPTPRFRDERRAVFDERVRTKRWLERYPRLRLETK